MSKMTDKEIIKALECCKYEYDTKCEACAYNFYSKTGCKGELRRNALDLINRQQAEIERLNALIAETNEYRGEVIHAITHIDEVKAEAIKEFIEEFTSRLEDYKYHDYTHGYFFYKDSIDHLVNYLKKEMAGADNA